MVHAFPPVWARLVTINSCHSTLRAILYTRSVFKRAPMWATGSVVVVVVGGVVVAGGLVAVVVAEVVDGGVVVVAAVELIVLLVCAAVVVVGRMVAVEVVVVLGVATSLIVMVVFVIGFFASVLCATEVFAAQKHFSTWSWPRANPKKPKVVIASP